jgi:hypothetical protein
MMRRSRFALVLAVLLCAPAGAQEEASTGVGAQPASGDASTDASTVVPELPFDDNPDPDQCGIPQPLGDGVTGVVTGSYDGRLWFEDVHLYDSHLRGAVTGTVPHGTSVQLVMFQNNPVLNYWLVRWEGAGGTVEGWAPDPFVRRD